MGVSIIENWTDVDGKVRALSPASDIAGQLTVDVVVQRTKPVEGFANLITAGKGTVLRVYVAIDVAKQSGIAVGLHIHCRVRRGGENRLFAHPTELRIG